MANTDISVMLHEANLEKKEANGRILMSIIQNTQFLGRQGLAFRGHDHMESSAAYEAQKS